MGADMAGGDLAGVCNKGLIDPDLAVAMRNDPGVAAVALDRGFVVRASISDPSNRVAAFAIKNAAQAAGAAGLTRIADHLQELALEACDTDADRDDMAASFGLIPGDTKYNGVA